MLNGAEAPAFIVVGPSGASTGNCTCKLVARALITKACLVPTVTAMDLSLPKLVLSDEAYATRAGGVYSFSRDGG